MRDILPETHVTIRSTRKGSSVAVFYLTVSKRVTNEEKNQISISIFVLSISMHFLPTNKHCFNDEDETCICTTERNVESIIK